MKHSRYPPSGIWQPMLRQINSACLPVSNWFVLLPTDQNTLKRNAEACELMFNAENATKDIPVTIVLTTGEVQYGKLIIAMTSDLPRSLNGDSKYFEFENLAGDRCFFSALAISQITPTDIPKVKKLDAGTDSDESFNPYRVLKISPDADLETIKHAYHEQVKKYHPDSFTGAELPAEMARYADNMSRLVNAAFQILNTSQGKTKDQPSAAAPVAPVQSGNG